MYPNHPQAHVENLMYGARHSEDKPSATQKILANLHGEFGEHFQVHDSWTLNHPSCEFSVRDVSSTSAVSQITSSPSANKSVILIVIDDTVPTSQHVAYLNSLFLNTPRDRAELLNIYIILTHSSETASSQIKKDAILNAFPSSIKPNVIAYNFRDVNWSNTYLAYTLLRNFYLAAFLTQEYSIQSTPLEDQARDILIRKADVTAENSAKILFENRSTKASKLELRQIQILRDALEYRAIQAANLPNLKQNIRPVSPNSSNGDESDPLSSPQRKFRKVLKSSESGRQAPHPFHLPPVTSSSVKKLTQSDAKFLYVIDCKEWENLAPQLEALQKSIQSKETPFKIRVHFSNLTPEKFAEMRTRCLPSVSLNGVSIQWSSSAEHLSDEKIQGLKSLGYTYQPLDFSVQQQTKFMTLVN